MGAIKCTARECSHIKSATGSHCRVENCPNYIGKCTRCRERAWKKQ